MIHPSAWSLSDKRSAFVLVGFGGEVKGEEEVEDVGDVGSLCESSEATLL